MSIDNNFEAVELDMINHEVNDVHENNESYEDSEEKDSDSKDAANVDVPISEKSSMNPLLKMESKLRDAISFQRFDSFEAAELNMKNHEVNDVHENNESYEDSEEKDSDIKDAANVDVPISEKSSMNPLLNIKCKLRDAISFQRFDSYTPKMCIDMMKNPSLKFLAALNKKLKQNESGWNVEFLEQGGGEALMDLVDILGVRRVVKLSDAMLLLECVQCVKSLMNSRMGLGYLVEHGDTLSQLVRALDTNNVMVKKQVLELLSALCVYSSDGYRLTMTALGSFKVAKKHRYKFSVIVHELRTAEIVPYKTTLIAFINCILVATEELEERVRLRNQFIGLNLLDILDDLRSEEDDDLVIQCNVFDDEKQADDDAYNALNPVGIDITDHNAVFNALYQKVYNTPHSDDLLTILQTLLRIDTDNSDGDVRWDCAESAIRQAIVMPLPRGPISLPSVRGAAVVHS